MKWKKIHLKIHSESSDDEHTEGDASDGNDLRTRRTLKDNQPKLSEQTEVRRSAI